MEVRAAETERADAGATHAAGRLRPVGELGIDVEGRMLEVDVRVLLAAVETRGQNLVVQRQGCLQEAGGAGGAFQMADVRFHRSERNAVRLCTSAREHVGQALHLDDVADSSGCAMAFNIAGRRRSESGIRPRTLYCELLADRVRRRDALALAVT